MAYELFVDSFDTWTGSNAARWVLSADVTVDSSTGRRGTNALKITSGANTRTVDTFTFSASTHVVIGFAFFRTPGSTATLYHDIIFRNSTNTLTSLRIDADGVLRITLGGTTYTSAKSISNSAWAYIEIGAVIGNAGSFEVRVNGSSSGWIALTGVDTQPSTITSVNNIRLSIVGSSSNTSGTTLLDDLRITYGNELKWLGDIRVDALALTADSSPQDWTPDTGNAWERLNNTTAGYITGTTLNDESLFALADYVPQTTAIHGVQVSAYARKTDAGSRSMAIEVKSDTTTDVGDTISLGDTTTEYRQVWLTDPDTAAAWTDGGLDALEIGVKVMD